MSLLPKSQQTGVTLVELVIAIVVISVGFSGLMWSYSNIISQSANPVIYQQAINIANSMMEEIVAKSYPEDDEFKDDNDCDPEPVSRDVWNDMCDYHSYTATDIEDVVGNDSGIKGYAIAVTVVPGGTALGLADNNDALRITVSVNHPLGGTIELATYRTKY